MTKKKTVLLIDGDVFVYQIGLAVERVIDWGNDLWVNYSDLNDARETLITRVQSLIKQLGADQVRFALSCPTDEGFRRGICSTYKANRKDQRKPIVHAPLREYLLNEHDTLQRPNLEADDILGILATQPTDERRIIVSVDKDFAGVPCLFYRTNDPVPVLREVSPFDAAKFHAVQTLAGDRVDGYTGIPGVGPKTAEKILDGLKPEEFWPAIVKAYTDEGLKEEHALTNARLARILQHGDYDINTGVIKLWTPSSPASARKGSVKKSPATSAVSKTSSTATRKKATS